MSLFGKPPVPVEGRIEVRNRPPDTAYELTTYFIASTARAAAPDDAGLESLARVAATVKPSSSRMADQGYMFTAELPPGHWQVIVLSRPYSTNPRTTIPADRTKLRTHRPHAKAFEVIAGQPKVLALKLEMDPIAPPVEAPVARRFLDRIGPVIRERLANAVALAQQEDKTAAMEAYAELAVFPDPAHFDAATRAELRIVAETGRARCLTDLGRSADALGVIDALGSVQQVLAAASDPTTVWEYFGTSAIARGLADDDGLEMRRRANTAIVALRGFFARPGPERSDAELLAVDVWTRCLRVYLAARAWNGLLAFADDGVMIADDHRLGVVNWFARCARIEALIALGNAPKATAEAQAILELTTRDGTTHATIEHLLGASRRAGLSAATILLRGVLIPA